MLISCETVRYIVRKYKTTKCISNLFGCGQKRKSSAVIDGMIRRKIKPNRGMSVHTVKAKIEAELGNSLGTNKIRNCAHEVRLFGRVTRKKSLISKMNRAND